MAPRLIKGICAEAGEERIALGHIYVDEPLLGVMALEAPGLAVDPVSGELRPTRGFLARA